ncbi:Tetraspanin-33 [Nibea albiflora]|uniref:Tetraspanin-33 n=1 Tax=Nibea albiflora TaxID=240163 RepID=A0ACB7EN04_NIBAL|nr:Tetraspanin-33 [Nibea albiflora]
MERTEKLMMKAIFRYREDQDLENAIDFIQKKVKKKNELCVYRLRGVRTFMVQFVVFQFQCCGVESYKDWSQNVYFECSDTNPSLEACGVPFSCCVHLQNQTVLNTMCGYGMQQLDKHSAAQDGLHPSAAWRKIVWWAKNNLLLVAGSELVALLLLEVCMICLAAVQISRIKKVQRLKEQHAARGSSERKDSYWYPAFADFDDE